MAIAEERTVWVTPRPGKRVGVFSVIVERQWKGCDYQIRRVMRVVERTIDKHGQCLAIPGIEIEGWWTSLQDSSWDVIDLHADHGTSEQFHSEFKTDMDIERLPSRYFATNALVLACSVLVYNILRYLGQNGLTGPDTPIRHKAKCRRIRTVMQELIYLAGKFIKIGRRLKIKFGKYCQVKDIFSRLYHRLAYS